VDTADAGPKPVVVEATDVVVRNVPLVIDSVGHLEARVRVALGPLVNARIEAVQVSDGAQVASGAELVRFDPRAFQAALLRAEAEREARAAQTDSLVSRLERSQESITAGLLSPQQAQDLRNELAQAQAAVRGAEAAVVLAKLDLENCVMHAPFAGRVGLVSALAGNYVSAGSSPLLELRALDMLEVDFSVAEEVLTTLRGKADGLPPKVIVRREGHNARTLEGVLAAFDNKIDARTRSLALRAAVPNRDGDFWPGEFVNVSLILGEETNATLVPFKAMNTGPNGPYLYVIEGGKAKMITVDVGEQTGELVVVRKGIAEGQKVIVSGQLGLQDGTTVRLAGAAAAAAKPKSP
jgi:multidrug efflux system membrane fusion protein